MLLTFPSQRTVWSSQTDDNIPLRNLLCATGARNKGDLTGQGVSPDRLVKRETCNHAQAGAHLEEYAEALAANWADKALSHVPLAYLALFQFVQHDLAALIDGNEASLPINLRSGAFSLSSVYGGLTIEGSTSRLLARCLPWPWDRAKLWAGSTIGRFAGRSVPPTDAQDFARDVLRLQRVVFGDAAPLTESDFFVLPRHLRDIFIQGGSLVAMLPFISEPRNDRDLLLSQLHLAIVRHHNREVDRIDQISTEPIDRHRCRRRAQKKTIRSLASAVSGDLAPMFCAVPFPPTADTTAATVPLEFVAAFGAFYATLRAGSLSPNTASSDTHSALGFEEFHQLRERNQLPEPLFQNSVLSARLLSRYQVDWNRFADPWHPSCVRLGHVPDRKNADWAKEEIHAHLIACLRRGIPSGQHCYDALMSSHSDGVRLDATACRRILGVESSSMFDDTPLAAYVIAEAAELGNDGRLGPLGSKLFYSGIRSTFNVDPADRNEGGTLQDFLLTANAP